MGSMEKELSVKGIDAFKGLHDLNQNRYEIVPDIHHVHTPGHTVGHLSIYINSEGNYLLVVSDILNDPTTLQHLTSHIRAEMSPKQCIETRRSFLQDAIDKSALLFVCHYPFPGLGHIAKEDLRW